MSRTDYPFRNLVFEGGGVKGIAYCGALGVLDERGILSWIRRVGGASAGAINATILALGYTVDEKFGRCLVGSISTNSRTTTSGLSGMPSGYSGISAGTRATFSATGSENSSRKKRTKPAVRLPTWPSGEAVPNSTSSQPT